MAEQQETTEQHLARLEEARIQQQAASLTLLDIVKGIDRNVTELTGSVRSIQVQQTMIDARLGAVDARMNAVESRMNAVQRDMEASFRQVAATMATKDDLDEFKRDMNARFDQVIALLTQKQGE